MPRSPAKIARKQSGDVKAEQGRAKSGTAQPLIPPKPTLPALRAAASGCKACDLWKTGTQTVFGEGRAGSQIMFVGEQPGDREDRAGSPFVGPAGLLLDRALSEAGINRAEAYVTNAVKHFKWEPRGKRRIHKNPRASEIEACKPWLEAEIAVVKPRLVVCLGGCYCRASLAGQDFQRDSSKRRAVGIETRRPSYGNGPPVLAVAADRRD